MPHTLLLADDSVTIQRVIELTFADEDIQVVAVSDGDKAIEHLDANRTDIVLADIGMPGKSGYEVAQYIRQSPRLRHIPVVLLTGAFEPVDQERASQAGCDGVLAKPFEPQQVIARVKELLARSPRKDEAGEPAPAAPPAAADIVWPGPPAPSAAPAATAKSPAPPLSTISTNDYFDKLDAAFAMLAASPAKAAPLSDLPAVAPEPLSSDLDWFASQLNPPAATASAKEWDLPGPAAASDADDLPLTTAEAPAAMVEDLILEAGAEEPGAEVPGAVLGPEVPGAEVPGAEVPGALLGADAQGAALEHAAPPETSIYVAPKEAPQHVESVHAEPAHAEQHSALPYTEQHSAPPYTEQHPAPPYPARHPAPSTPAPQHPLVLPSISDAFAALLAAEQNEPHPAVAPVWPVAGTSLPTPEPPPAPAPPPLDMDEVVERVTRRVLDQLSGTAIREAVADVTSSIAERLVREEIERIKSAIK